MKELSNERGTGRKKGEAEAGESKGEGGEDATLFFFCTGFSRRFPLIFRLLGFPVLTQPEVLFRGYQEEQD